LRKEVKRCSGRCQSKKSVEVAHQGKSISDSSLASVNKDWEHWVVMHGDEEAVREDVRGLGEAIGIHISGDGGNMLAVAVGGAASGEGLRVADGVVRGDEGAR
jgi:hypothetical protein